MTEVRFKVGEKAARETLAALVTLAPWYARPGLQGLLERVSARGIEVSVKAAQRRRTNEQNAYYWLCLGLFAKAVGMSPDEAHIAILSEHHGSTEVRIGSRTHHVPKGRSHNLSTADFSALIETLHRVSAFVGCVLPDPQEVA